MGNTAISAHGALKTPASGTWRILYLVGGIAALVAGIVFRRWLNAEYGLLQSMGVIKGGPDTPPLTIADWFGLLRSDSVVGLLFLNAFDHINYVLVGFIFLGLFAALRKAARSVALVSAILTFTGIAFFFLSNQAFTMLSLSRGYYAATSDIERAGFLSAGQTLITASDPMVFGNGVFWAFTLVTLAGVIVSVAMLRTGVFSKITGYLGLAANFLGLGYFVTVAVNPPLTFIPLSASAPFLMAWYMLIGIRLIKLYSSKGE